MKDNVHLSNLHFAEANGNYTTSRMTNRLLTYALVIEKLTKLCMRDHSFASEMQFYTQRLYTSDTGMSPIQIEQVKSVAALLRLIRYMRGAKFTHWQESSTHMRHDIEKNLQLSIIEALDSEIRQGNRDNALSGLIIMQYVTNRGSGIFVKQEENGNYQLGWPLGQAWSNDYTAWNMAFLVSKNQHPSAFAQLLIPAVTCNPSHNINTQQFAHFTMARLYSLYFYSIRNMSITDNEKYTSSRIVFPSDFARTFGQSNIQHTAGDIPSTKDIDDTFMQFRVANRVSITSILSPVMLQWIRAITLWVSVMVVGWGSEGVVALSIQQKIKQTKLIRNSAIEIKNATQEKHRWMMVQLVFPLCLSISLYSSSLFGLPFLVVGLWKFGTPEAYNLFYTSLQTSRSWLEATANFLGGIGTVFHHSFTSWFICSRLCNLMAPHHIGSYLAITTPLVVQHWCSCVVYYNFTLYVVIELVIEVWWEIEMFSNMHTQVLLHQKITFMGMMVAHWLYWLSGLLEQVHNCVDNGFLCEGVSVIASQQPKVNII
jgi:hypothetical protein